jgi:hypothetical protein
MVNETQPSLIGGAMAIEIFPFSSRRRPVEAFNSSPAEVDDFGAWVGSPFPSTHQLLQELQGLPLADLSHQIQLHGRVHFPFIGMTLV